MSQRYAQIVDGVVVNVILADPGFDPGDGSLLVQSDTAQTGDTYDADTGVFTPPPPPPPPPPDTTPTLTALQFIALLTPDEQVLAINNGYVQIAILNTSATAGPLFHLDDPVFTQGVSDMAANGIIDPSRVDAILAGTPPTV